MNSKVENCFGMKERKKNTKSANKTTKFMKCTIECFAGFKIIFVLHAIFVRT